MRAYHVEPRTTLPWTIPDIKEKGGGFLHWSQSRFGNGRIDIVVPTMEIIREATTRATQTLRLWRKYEVTTCDLRGFLVCAHTQTTHYALADRRKIIGEFPRLASDRKPQLSQLSHILKHSQSHTIQHLKIAIDPQAMLPARFARYLTHQFAIGIALLLKIRLLIIGPPFY